jgi:asparagine synthase (glutamine-hydrolysing)
MNVGGLAAALDKHGRNAVSMVLLMLRQLTHRGAVGFQVATPTAKVTGKSLNELEARKLVSNTALGHNSSLISSKGEHQSVLLEKNHAVVFEGHFFPLPKTHEINAIAHFLRPNVHKGANEIIRKFDGSYTFAITSSDRILVGRDQFGINPLFYGENEALCAVASERKALWALGIANVKSFPPGNVGVISTKGFGFTPAATLEHVPEKTMSLKKATDRLQTLISKSVMERLLSVGEAAVAFSGGLDSTVLAVVAKTCRSRLKLVSVGLENQPELEHARAVAHSIRLPFHFQTYTIDDVENVLETVLWLIEEPNLMKVGVAIPFFWTAEIASRIGCSVLLSGQGADELFGGYIRYLAEYRREGAQAVQKAMFHDLEMSYETNFQRDNAVCAFHKVELSLPYISRKLVHFASSLPLKLKIDSVDDSLRKRVLRQVAKDLGLPDLVTERTKKAVQYATGVDKALTQLAQRMGLTSHDYVNRIFEKICYYKKGKA